MVVRRVIAVIVLAVAALAVWFVLSLGDPVPWGKPATVDGDVVRTTYVGSECQTYDRVDVVEDDQRVVITVRETVLAVSCTDAGVAHEVRVELDEPLGDRALVDGACLLAELSERPTCDGDTIESGE